MKPRLLLGCLALLGLTAFAPAPFPRPRRSQTDVSVERIQGTWTILKLEMTDGKGGMTAQGDYLKEVRVEKGRWSFIYRNPASAPVVYQLAIDTSRTPAALDLTRPGQARPYGTGIILRQGNLMRVLYSFGSQRLSSFDRPPAGYWHLTLQQGR
jgi:hypothetical protein